MTSDILTKSYINERMKKVRGKIAEFREQRNDVWTKREETLGYDAKIMGLIKEMEIYELRHISL